MGYTLIEDEPKKAGSYTLVEEPKFDPTAGMSTTEKVLAGVGQGMTDLYMGAKQRLGLANEDDVRRKREIDSALLKTTAGKAGSIGGTIAGTLPAILVPGAATIPGAIAAGGAVGAMMPSESGQEQAKNAFLGAAGGVVGPALVRGGQMLKAAAEPFYQRGRDAIVGRTLRNASGSSVDDVVRNLSSGGEIVPGSLPTAAEVAGNPGIAAMQRSAFATNPTVAAEVAARQAANNEARIAALQKIIGDRNQLAQTRQDAVDALYAAANGQKITITPALEELLTRPVMRSATGEAANLAQNQGRSFSLRQSTPAQPSFILGANGQPIGMTPASPGSIMGRDAHGIKMAIDDAIEGGAGKVGMPKNQRRAATEVQSDFLSEVEKQVPAYGQARTTYADLSKPVNQSDVAQMILDRSTGNIQGNMTPAAFNRALSDRTAKGALQRKDATLADTFAPEQLASLNAVKSDLQRLDFSNNAGRGVGSDTVQKLAYSNMAQASGLPGLLSNSGLGQGVGSIMQRTGQLAYSDANRQISEQLARTLLDPKEAARLIAGAKTPEGLVKLQNALRKAGAITGPGSTMGLLSSNSEQ